MHIVHLATVDVEGGAARAAFRLHQGLLAAGVPSAMLVRRKASTAESVFVAPDPGPEEEFFWHLVEKFYLEPRRTALSNTYFSIGYPGFDVTAQPLVQQAEVLHLHWVAGFLSPGVVAALVALGKPVVWTLHDQRPLSGGCHFSAGCLGYRNDCASCPQLEGDALAVPAANLADQKRLIPAEALTVVAPSRWLADCARQSALFGRSRIEVIPYGVEIDRFCPRPRAEARRQLGLPEAGFQVLFGADYGSEKRKGFAELVTALNWCGADPEFRQKVASGGVLFLAFGRPNQALGPWPVPIKHVGYVNSDETLASLYSAANLFLLPSLEDNLPNTVLESMSCGTPVLAFRVGGLPDLVTDGVTGCLVRGGDTRALAEALGRLSREPERCAAWGEACRVWVEQNFSLENQARRYLSLYGQLEAIPRPAAFGAAPPPGEPGPNLGALKSRLMSDMLERFASSMKHATAAQRRTARDLIRAFRAQVATPALGDEMAWQQQLASLKSEFVAAEAERQTRLARRRNAKEGRRARRVLFWRRWSG